MFPMAQGIEEVFTDFSIEEGEEYSVKSIENIFIGILYDMLPNSGRTL